MSKILIATEKPFAKEAVEGIRSIVEPAGYELALLEEYTDVNELYKAVEDAVGLIVRSDKVTKEVIDHAKNLKIVVRAGAGYDNLDLEACTAKGVVAMNTPGQNANAVAELAVAMMLYMARGSFQPSTGSELKGKKLGIHAYGNIGRTLARIANGFGMEVFTFRPTRQLNAEDIEALKQEGVKPCHSAEDLYSSCDYVSLHIPSTPETKNSIDYALLSKMPKGGCLINTARKEVINEADLMKVLEERTDMKYATDVATGNHAELSEKFTTRVYATPKKMGAQTAEANINAGLAAATQIVEFLKDGVTTYKVN